MSGLSSVENSKIDLTTYNLQEFEEPALEEDLFSTESISEKEIPEFEEKKEQKVSLLQQAKLFKKSPAYDDSSEKKRSISLVTKNELKVKFPGFLKSMAFWKKKEDPSSERGQIPSATSTEISLESDHSKGILRTNSQKSYKEIRKSSSLLKGIEENELSSNSKHENPLLQFDITRILTLMDHLSPIRSRRLFNFHFDLEKKKADDVFRLINSLIKESPENIPTIVKALQFQREKISNLPIDQKSESLKKELDYLFSLLAKDPENLVIICRCSEQIDSLEYFVGLTYQVHKMCINFQETLQSCFIADSSLESKGNPYREDRLPVRLHTKFATEMMQNEFRQMGTLLMSFIHQIGEVNLCIEEKVLSTELELIKTRENLEKAEDISINDVLIKNWSNFINFSIEIVSRFNQIEYPKEIYQLFKMDREFIEEKFPDSLYPILENFVYLRLISPYLVQEPSLTDTKIRRSVAFTFMKLLQNPDATLFDDIAKQNQDINNLLLKFKEVRRDFIDSLSSKQG
jgi:hypothetical protein